MGVTGFGNRALPALFACGIFRRDEAQIFHQFSWGIKAREVANFGHDGDGDGTLDAAQGLQGLNHRVQAPRFDLVLEFLFETLQSFGSAPERPDIFLKDDLLRRGGTDDFREPPEVGRAPIGPAL